MLFRSYTEDLTKKVADYPEDFEVFGRKEEIENVVISLLRKTKNSPLLIGEAGVGKTAIVVGQRKTLSSTTLGISKRLSSSVKMIRLKRSQ